MRSLNLALRFGLIALAATTGAHAGSMRSGGEGFVYTSLRLDHGDRFFDKDGKLQDDKTSRCGTGSRNSWYAEYGYSYYHTVFASTAIDLNPCSGGTSIALGGTEVGIRGRVFEFSDSLIWETALALPTEAVAQRNGRHHDKIGLGLSLHFRPGPDPYDITIPRPPFEGQWRFSTGVNLWTDGSPTDAWVQATWGRTISAADWRTGNGPWAFSASLRGAHSLWNTRASRRTAVDPTDSFYIVSLSLSLSKQLTRLDSFSIGIHHDLLGKNHGQSTAISIGYDHDFRN